MALTGVAGVAITVYIHISTTYVQYYSKVVLDGILLGMVLVALVLLFKPGARRPKRAWFLEIVFVKTSVCVCVCLCVCPPPRLLKTIHVK